jgi:hypothetical protein
MILQIKSIFTRFDRRILQIVESWLDTTIFRGKSTRGKTTRGKIGLVESPFRPYLT